MKTAAVLTLAILSQAAGNVCLTKGMKALAAGDLGLADKILIGAQTPMLWAGTALLIVFFALYSAALSWVDLSFVLPATSFGYVLNVACGYYFLNEQVRPSRWVGALVITLGVVLVSRSGVRTVEPPGREAADALGVAGGGQ